MATLVKTPANTGKAVIRKRGWPITIKTFRTKRDALVIQDWRMGLVYNPVAMVRKPPAGPGRNHRLMANEERELLTACDQANNPMLGWMVKLAIYTGMRAGEIQTLRRNQVDADAWPLHPPVRAEDLVDRLDQLASG